MKKRKISGNPLKDFEYSFNSEIDFSEINDSNIEKKLPYILNFYHRFYDYKDSRNFLCKIEKKFSNKIKSLNDSEYYNYITLGFVADLIYKTNTTNDNIIKWYKDNLNKLLNVDKNDKRAFNNSFDIQKAILEKALEIMPEIEQYIDDQIYKNESNFDLQKHLEKYNLSPLHIRKIFNILKEDQTVFLNFDEWDEYTVESYRHLSIDDVKRIVKIYDDVLEILEKYITFNTKKKSVSRAPKKISMEKKISGLKFLKNDNLLGIVSEKPEKIFGSTLIMLYNVKTKRVRILESERGMILSGSTVKDFDNSVEKPLKEPQEFFKGIGGGKRKIKNMYNNIPSKEYNSTGRINKDTLIIKIY